MIRSAIEKIDFLYTASSASKTKMISYGIMKKYKAKDIIFYDEDNNKTGYILLYMERLKNLVSKV